MGVMKEYMEKQGIQIKETAKSEKVTIHRKNTA